MVNCDCIQDSLGASQNARTVSHRAALGVPLHAARPAHVRPEEEGSPVGGEDGVHEGAEGDEVSAQLIALHSIGVVLEGAYVRGACRRTTHTDAHWCTSDQAHCPAAGRRGAGPDPEYA